MIPMIKLDKSPFCNYLLWYSYYHPDASIYKIKNELNLSEKGIRDLIGRLRKKGIITKIKEGKRIKIIFNEKYKNKIIREIEKMNFKRAFLKSLENKKENKKFLNNFFKYLKKNKKISQESLFKEPFRDNLLSSTIVNTLEHLEYIKKNNNYYTLTELGKKIII